MLRHTAECRERGVPFAADPSQTLTFLDGEAIRQLVTGAAYLFTNEYEAGLVADKTGWSDAEILDLVGTRITTHGAAGSVISRKGEPDIRVAIAEADQVVDPTGTGDGFRAGFLSGIAWGLGLERVGPGRARWSPPTWSRRSGPQDYAFTAESFLARASRRPTAADAARELTPHLA